MEEQVQLKTLTWNSKPLVSPREFCDMLGGELSMPSVRCLYRQKGFPCIRVGRKILIPVQAAYEWLNSQRL